MPHLHQNLKNLPCGTFIYAASCRKKKCSEISFLSRFARKKCSLRSQEISHYSGLRPSPPVRAVNEKFLSNASLRSELLWRHKGVRFGSKYIKMCVLIFLTLLESFVEIGWKLFDLGQKNWFSGFSDPRYDVIEGSDSAQNTPKCVFLYSKHFWKVLLISDENCSI